MNYQLDQQRIARLQALILALYQEKSDGSPLFKYEFHQACEQVASQLLDEISELKAFEPNPKR